MPGTLQTPTCDSNELDDDLGEFVLIDDLFKARAKDEVQRPLIAFPKSERGATDFEFFTGSDLDRFVAHAARYYVQAGLQVVRSSAIARFSAYGDVTKKR